LPNVSKLDINDVSTKVDLNLKSKSKKIFRESKSYLEENNLHLILYFIHEDTLKQVPLIEIRARNSYIRKSYSVKELDSLNWVTIYP
jgi:hypothetical protein